MLKDLGGGVTLGEVGSYAEEDGGRDVAKLTVERVGEAIGARGGCFGVLEGFQNSVEGGGFWFYVIGNYFVIGF